MVSDPIYRPAQLGGVHSLGSIAWGQGGLGGIVGRVTDSSGAAIPGSQVEMRNEDTGVSSRAQTAATGEYIFTNVTPGSYRVSVSAPGFKTNVARNLRVFVNETVRADVTMDVGDVATQVEVEASMPVVQTDASSVGSVVDGRQVTKMPLNGRGSIYALLSLAPGVQNAGSNPNIAGGLRSGYTNLSVDGVGNNDVGNERLLAPIPSLDAVAEFRVIANGASAEFGRGGAQVVVVTKSGTNEFRGSLFAFNRNRATAAKEFFATGLPLPAFNRNEYGGSLGGPVLRNKLFFFGSFEGLRRNVSTTNVVAMPTVALKSGDFSNLPAIRDPFASGVPFAGNRIPSNRISPVSSELLKFTSDPNGRGTGAAGLGNNFTTNIPTREPLDRFSGRGDYQISSKDRVTVRYFHVNNGPFAQSSNGTDKFGNWGGFGIATRNALGSYTRVLSPRTINEARFGFNQEKNFRTPQNSDFDPSKLIPGLISPLPGLGGLPTITILGFRGFSDNPGSGDVKRSYEFYDNFTWIRDKHALKAGFEFQHSNAFNFQNPPPFRGSFAFDGRYSGHAFADFLLGALTATGRVSKNVESEPVSNRYAAYLQDDWSITPRLTLNLGVRYEYYGLFRNAQGDMANFYPDLGMVLLAGEGDPRLLAALPIKTGKSVGLDSGNYLNKDVNNFAPRIGFAFRPLGTSRLVVRSSYGIYHNVIAAYGGNFHVALNPPFRVAESFEPAAGPVPTLTFASPFPGRGSIPSYPDIYALDRGRAVPYHQQWNLTLEGEVFRNTSVRASYLGSKGTHLGATYDLNAPRPAPGAINPRRPFQPYGTFNYYDSSRDSMTHQLQIGAVRRFASGLSFQAEYQWTKSLGNSESTTDRYDFTRDRGNLDGIRPHYVTINYIYDLPFGNGRKFLASLPALANKVIGGWQVGGIATLGTGQPYSVTFTSTTLGWPSSRADVVGDPALSGPVVERWFNAAAFRVPAPFTFGNSARNLLFGPGFASWDTAIYKQTALTERLNLEFRAEFFNTLNHPSFRNPASNISVPAQVGRITATSSTARNVQFGMRLSF
ncbi:MAG: hypothetical protein FJW40_00475 [Acidobacteria bacterium]|nr:hypothetical protein [Acidobacteriota bacterium]